jgi:hypothetical protein
MGATHGRVTNPHTGGSVEWTLAQPIADINAQCKEAGIVCYTIGNSAHLRGTGDHTPWSRGKPAGKLFAADVMKSGHADVERRILALMRDPDYDTTWIDFVNVNGSQYDYAGKWLKPSGDHHLHVSVEGWAVREKVTLIRDMFGGPKPDSLSPKPDKPQPRRVGIPMFTLVKVRNDPKIYKAEAGRLLHLTPVQFRALQAALRKYGVVDEPFVVADEHELAAFGVESTEG